MIEDDDNEKDYKFFKIILLLVESFIIGICVIFFLGVSKVDALDFTNALLEQYNTSNSLENDQICNASNMCSIFTNNGNNVRNVLKLTYRNSSFWPDQAYTMTINYRVIYYQSVLNPSGTINLGGPSLYWVNGNGTETEIKDNCSTSYTQTTTPTANKRQKSFNFTTKCNWVVPPSTQIDFKIKIPYATNITNIESIELRYVGYSDFKNKLATEVSDDDRINDNLNNINGTLVDGFGNIISNQNNNTNSIINNDNANTDKITDAIENQNIKCETYNFNNDKLINVGYISSNGNIITNTPKYYYTDFIPIQIGEVYIINKQFSGGSGAAYCLYNSNKQIIRCSNYTNATGNITINNQDANYIRYSGRVDTQDNTYFTGKYCYNIIEKQNESLDDINSSLNDSSVDDPSGMLGDLESNFANNGAISNLLLMPVIFYNQMLLALDSVCIPYTIGDLFGHTLRLPCIDLKGILGNTLYNTIDAFMFFGLMLAIRKKLVDIFEHFTSLKTGGNELE